jgi:MerR HTH family regulatory protein
MIRPKNAKKPRKRAPKNGPRDGSGRPMLTRHEAARRLGIPRTTLRHWEKSGRIQCVVDAEGWHWFNADEVERAVQTHSTVAAQATRLFAEGKSVTEVVIALGVDPAAVRGWKIGFDEDQARDNQQLVVRVPHDLQHWAKVFNTTVEDLRSPTKLLCALELCLSAPDLRARLDEAVEQALRPKTTT